MSNKVEVQFGVEGYALVASAFNQISSAAQRLASIIAGGVLTEFIKHSIDVADEMGKMAQKTGIAVEQLSQLALPAKLAGVDLETLRGALKNLATQMVEQGRGSEGLTDELLRLSDVFQQMPDGAAKTALAVKLFERSGQAMIPVLNAGSKALRDQMEESRALGVVIGPGLSQQAEKFNDNLTRMKEAALGIALAVADRLLPYLNALSDSLVEFAKNGETAKTIAESVLGTFQALASAAVLVQGGFGAIATFIMTAQGAQANGRLPSEIEKEAQQAALEIAKETSAQLKAIWEDRKKASEMAAEQVAKGGATGISLDQLKAEREKNAINLRNIDLNIEELRLNNASTEEMQQQIELKREYIALNQEQSLQAFIGHAIPAQEALKIQLEDRKSLLEIEKEIQQLHAKDLQTKLANIDADFRLTDVEKDRRTRMALESARFQGVPGASDQLGRMGPSPESFGEQFTTTVVKLQNQWGTFATQMADTFATVFNGAISSISDGITGLIEGTKTWSQALLGIASSIIHTIIQSIVQMGVRWVATQLLMAVAGKAIAAATIGSLVPIAGAQAAIWATPATLATIASYGGAAEAAPGAIGLAEGLVMAQALAGFAEGGYTGAGSKWEPAGLVHRNEFVFNSDAVNRIGLNNLEAMHEGRGSSPAVANKNTFIIVKNEQEYLNAMKSEAGKKIIFDTFNERRLDMGFDT